MPGVADAVTWNGTCPPIAAGLFVTIYPPRGRNRLRADPPRDPHGKPLPEVRALRDGIERRVAALFDELERNG
ncbi:hypothetical protein [Salinirarus marinus]|uniref:hypothetical protein n=1 Tax=Salinirarus marinus TaxID=3068310 RepID=UPI003C6CAFC7